MCVIPTIIAVWSETDLCYSHCMLSNFLLVEKFAVTVVARDHSYVLDCV